MAHNMSLIIMMIIAIILLFASMVLSAMASSSAKKNCTNDTTATKYAAYSAVVCGVSLFLIGIALVLYLFRQPIGSGIANVAGINLQQQADALNNLAASLSATAEKMKPE